MLAIGYRIGSLKMRLGCGLMGKRVAHPTALDEQLETLGASVARRYFNGKRNLALMVIWQRAVAVP